MPLVPDGPRLETARFTPAIRAGPPRRGGEASLWGRVGESERPATPNPFSGAARNGPPGDRMASL